MKMPAVSLLTLFALAAHGGETPSAYVGQETRAIKALAPDEVTQLLTGKGMGLAKAAELNGYPGPSHVLELAAELQLTDAQRQATDALYSSMQATAKALGQQIVSKEKSLDDMFARKTISEPELARAVDDIGALQSRLRATHLQAHLAEAKVLTSEQMTRYFELRGYSARDPDHVHHHGN